MFARPLGNGKKDVPFQTGIESKKGLCGRSWLGLGRVLEETIWNVGTRRVALSLNPLSIGCLL